MKRRLLAGLLAAAGGCSVAAAMPADDADLAAAQVQAEAAAADFSGRLRQTLGAAMAEGGPVAGVRTCRDEAPRIAADVAAAHGVRIGRVGVRVRNPANAPGGWTATVLEDFTRRAAAGEAPANLLHRGLDTGSDTLRVARGIATEPACLGCHGPAVPDVVGDAVRALYPQDRATGFEAGSLRGLLWVEVPVPRGVARAGDGRAAVTLTPRQSDALRREMRGQLERMESALAALGTGDWPALAAAAATPPDVVAPGEGADFRRRLPPRWFALVRPMNEAFAAAASEAGEGRRADVAGRHLADAMAQCNSCHAAFRVREDTPARLAADDVRELFPTAP